MTTKSQQTLSHKHTQRHARTWPDTYICIVHNLPRPQRRRMNINVLISRSRYSLSPPFSAMVLFLFFCNKKQGLEQDDHALHPAPVRLLPPTLATSPQTLNRGNGSGHKRPADTIVPPPDPVRLTPPTPPKPPPGIDDADIDRPHLPPPQAATSSGQSGVCFGCVSSTFVRGTCLRPPRRARLLGSLI